MDIKAILPAEEPDDDGDSVVIEWLGMLALVAVVVCGAAFGAVGLAVAISAAVDAMLGGA